MCHDPLTQNNTAGIPLTRSNALKAVQGMKVWQANKQLASRLFIPRWKKESILQNPDKIEQQKLIIDYWMNTDPFASWRRLITTLDWMRETELADSIRHNAEPLSGVSVNDAFSLL